MSKEKSEIIEQAEELFREMDEKLKLSPLTHSNGLQLIKIGAKLLMKCEELEKSRDNHAQKRKYWENQAKEWRKKYEELKDE